MKLWPFGRGPKKATVQGDLSGDTIDADQALKKKVDDGFNPIVEDIKLVRSLHFRALSATIGAVIILLLFLWQMVGAFSHHIRSSTEFMTTAIGQDMSEGAYSKGDTAGRFRKIALAKEDVKESKGDKEKDDVKPKDDATAKSLSDRAHLYAMLSSYQTNLSTSTVAVISILVIAISVITVSLLRAALDVKPYVPPAQNTPEAVAEVVVAPAKNEGFVWPSLQFVKDGVDVVLSIFKKKE